MRKTFIALSAAAALGIVGAASVARANDSGENHQDEDRVATRQINHPAWSGNFVSAGGAYGFAAEPARKHHTVREQTQSR
jgi:hypothetical protein